MNEVLFHSQDILCCGCRHCSLNPMRETGLYVCMYVCMYVGLWLWFYGMLNFIWLCRTKQLYGFKKIWTSAGHVITSSWPLFQGPFFSLG